MPCSKKRILLTGGTGLIGRQLWKPLIDAGFDVYIVSRKTPDQCIEGIHFIEGSLFNTDTLDAMMALARPTHLLHLAWATTEDYLHSNSNLDYVAASLQLLTRFHQQGGQRVVFVGTCFEYAFKETPLREGDPTEPATLYATCKNTLRQLFELFCERNALSYAWGRIFYVYGEQEHPTRFTAALIQQLQQNQPFVIKGGPLKKDYLYTKDIAFALTALLQSEAQGVVNLCSGIALTLREYAETIAKVLGKPQLLVFQDDCQGQPPCIVGDATRLIEEVGFTPRYTLQEALEEMLHPSLEVLPHG
jgi:nucleoside-diphosphate-sugar epimerase